MMTNPVTPLANPDPNWMDAYIDRQLDLLGSGYTSFGVKFVEWPQWRSDAFVRLVKVIEADTTFVYREDTGERHHGPVELGVAYRVQNFPDPVEG